MRALLLLGFLAAAAQEPQPDTTDWHTYFPLAVGPAWEIMELRDKGGEYPYFVEYFVEYFVLYEIQGDSLLQGEPHFVLTHCEQGPDLPTACDDEAFLVRYDEATRSVVRLYEDGSSGALAYFPWLGACELDAPFDYEPGESLCPESWYWVYVTGTYDHEHCLGDDCLTRSYKQFVNTAASVSFQSGLGFVESAVKGAGGSGLRYARIDGVEYGTSVVANEPAALAPGTSALTVTPNPLRERARLGFALGRPEALTLAVFDLQGRRVRTEPLGERGAGRQSVAFETGGLPAGAYVLRLTGDGGFEAARGVIVLR